MRTAENPWFLSNTETINYCIEADETIFGDIKTPLDTQIDLAFTYWREHFGAAEIPTLNGSEVSLAMAGQRINRQGRAAVTPTLLFTSESFLPISAIISLTQHRL